MKILLLSFMLLTGERQGVSPPSASCDGSLARSAAEFIPVVCRPLHYAGHAVDWNSSSAKALFHRDEPGGGLRFRRDLLSGGTPEPAGARSGLLLNLTYTSMSPIQDEGGLSDDAIDRAGEQVMNGHDFRSVRRRVLEKVEVEDLDKGFLKEALSTVGSGIRSFFEAIGDFFRWLFSGSGRRTVAPPPPPAAPPTMPSTGGGFTFPDLSGLGTVLIFVCVAAVIFVLIALIVKSIEARKKKASDGLDELGDALADITAPPGELAASTYEGRAIQMARDGNYRAAIRELLLGSMSWIERAGLIRYRKGLTNRDYVRSVWRRMDKREAYLMTATQFEYVFFGRRIPTAEMFEHCLTSFRGAFREEETPTAAV